MPNPRLIYIAGYSIKKNTGRNKATREKTEALKKILGNENFKRFSPPGYSNKLLTYLSMLFFDGYLFFRLLFLNRETYVIERQAFLPLTNALLKWKGNKIICEIHADILDELPYLDKNRIEKKILRLLESSERLNLKLSAGIICNHPNRQAAMQRLYAKPCIYQYNGANTRDFIPKDMMQCRHDLQLHPTAKYFLFSGMISKWHGVEWLIGIFNQAVLSLKPDHYLLIVGASNDPYSASLKKMAASNPQIVFINKVSFEKVVKYINAADLCLLPVNDLRNSPGSPLKLYDYIACGKPVVTQEKMPGYSDEVLLYNLGSVVDFTDPQNAARHLLDFCNNADPDFYRTNNRNTALACVSWEERMQGCIDFVQTL